MYVVLTFYKFVDIADPVEMRESLLRFCKDNGIKGTVLLASEGINATLVGVREAIDRFRVFMSALNGFRDLFFQESEAQLMPFQKMKVKVKPEIVTLKVDDLDMSQAGEYVPPQDWDAFISREDVKVIDTRNSYEVAMGSFKGAINPNTNNFSDFVTWVAENLQKSDPTQPIGMFCTGGVRCEKSTAYLKKMGFKNVYHLQGGIINYLSYKKGDDGTWEGLCFIFDDRLALDANLRVVNP